MFLTRSARLVPGYILLVMLAMYLFFGNAIAESSTLVTLQASASDRKVDLSWSVNGDLSYIQVYRDTDANPEGRGRIAILRGDVRSYTDTAVANGQQYWYWIKYADTNRGVGNSNAGNATPTASSQIENGNNCTTEPVTGQYYSIVNQGSSKAIDISSGEIGNGANAIQWPYKEARNQQFTLTDLGNGYWSLTAAHSGRVLDVSGWSTADGGNIFQWDHHGGNNQQWKLMRSSSGAFNIVSRHSGKALTVSNDSDGANIYQKTASASTYQAWYFNPLGRNCSNNNVTDNRTLKLGVGWNAGNTLEAIGGETAWGNPLLTQQLFNSVKAAGFDTVRLPVAWSVFSDETSFVIDSVWMTRVKQVVDYALKADLYVIMNIHWDGGWMQPTNAKKNYVNNRLSIMWKQIANNFRDYDHRLLFAGTNEVMVDGDYGTPTQEYITVQNSFNQTFVSTVRATGGKNADRYLVVQGFNTNINHTVDFAVLPRDTVSNRLMIEVHFYDPYNFTLNTKSSISQWGAIATDSTAVEDWANESWVDSQFLKMKNNFVDKGVPVILGEFAVAARLGISGHERYRVYWNEYISNSAIEHGLVPIYWDAGSTADGGTGVFNRNTGNQVYPDIISAIVGAVK